MAIEKYFAMSLTSVTAHRGRCKLGCGWSLQGGSMESGEGFVFPEWLGTIWL